MSCSGAAATGATVSLIDPEADMKSTITMKDFLGDGQGRRFADVANDPHVQWDKWVAWLNNRPRQECLEMAEVHFDMPALAGILRELEAEPFVRDYFDRRTPQATLRTKQALGVLVKLHMERRGWSTTGTKGPLGRRDPLYSGRGDHNGPRSFSRYWQSAERYKR
ncbi:hypothetical protein CO151_12295 [bacterium CG_4_9_14_3_um_filter_65_15]|nr:MAG: hypothetical protein CO151_12295 [bacterium CG_4_9_14_3_um_filter_65_15]